MKKKKERNREWVLFLPQSFLPIFWELGWRNNLITRHAWIKEFKKSETSISTFHRNHLFFLFRKIWLDLKSSQSCPQMTKWRYKGFLNFMIRDPNKYDRKNTKKYYHFGKIIHDTIMARREGPGVYPCLLKSTLCIRVLADPRISWIEKKNYPKFVQNCNFLNTLDQF